MIDEAGLTPEITQTDEDTPLVRTAVEPGCRRSPREWTRGAVKTVPPQWLPGSAGIAGLDIGRRHARRPTAIYSAWTRTRRTPIRRWHRR